MVPHLAQPHQQWETRSVLLWGDGGECTQGLNPRCICPQTVRVSRPHPSAFTVLCGSVDECGSWGGQVARKNTFLESPFDNSFFFVKNKYFL